MEKTARSTRIMRLYVIARQKFKNVFLTIPNSDSLMTVKFSVYLSLSGWDFMNFSQLVELSVSASGLTSW